MTEQVKNKEKILQKRLDRQTQAREQAEELLESKSLELYQANQLLENTVQAAKNNSARLNAIMNSIKDNVIATDCDLKVLDANKACEHFFELSHEDLLNMYLLDYLDEDQSKDYVKFCEDVQSNNQTLVDGVALEFDFQFKTGSHVPVEVSISIFKHNSEVFLLHVIRDLTRRKELEVERQQMQNDLAHATKWEAVGQLAGGIAHEINTPSQYIGDNLSFIESSIGQVFAILEKALMLKHTCKDKEEYAPLIKNIDDLIDEHDLEFLLEEMPLALKQSRNGIAQVSKIVLAMKNFSHPGTKEKEPINLHQTIETTLTVSRNEWKSVADVETDFDDSLGMVNCIPSEMNQVFLNIIVNAAHAIEDAHVSSMGRIKISTRKLEKSVEIRISDNGSGIPEEYQANIFNPFFTTKDVGKGTGQGLSIAHDIVVKKHEGTLSFETEQGKGTSFIIWLPHEAV